MKMTILLSFLEINHEEECRVCLREPPFSVINHKYCAHNSVICMECFQDWFSRNGQCDICRKTLLQFNINVYIIQGNRKKENKYFFSKNDFLKSLRDVKEKDFKIIKNSIDLFDDNFNLIEKYQFHNKRKKNKTIMFFKIFNSKIH